MRSFIPVSSKWQGKWQACKALITGAGLKSLLMSLAVIAALAFFFYRSVTAAVLMLPLVYPLTKRELRIRREKRQRALTISFREVMNSVSASLKAGYSAENAFRAAYADMVMLFGRNSPIAEELFRICTGMDSNVPLERLLRGFAQRTGSEEITEFAEVFAIAKRSGGNMAAIMDRTGALIRSRLDTEEEIGVMVSAKKMEQKIMDTVPFLILLYISAASGGFFDVLYHNPAGILIMTGCMGAYLAAFVLSEKIADIRV